MKAWRSYQVITTIVVGIIGLIAFFVWGKTDYLPRFLFWLYSLILPSTEAFTSIAFPLVPMHLFKNRNYVILMACSTLGSMIFYALSIIWPQQIAVLFQVSPEDIGWISVSFSRARRMNLSRTKAMGTGHYHGWSHCRRSHRSSNSKADRTYQMAASDGLRIFHCLYRGHGIRHFTYQGYGYCF